MSNKLIAQGAEAKLYLNSETNTISKERISKGYRHPKLDESIRKSRTKKEKKLLEKAKDLAKTNAPEVLNKDVGKKIDNRNKKDFKIEMEFIEGDKLSDTLNKYNKEKQSKVMQQLGKETSKLHENHIIHGDLTTSNTILKDNKVYIIDFGLGFISTRTEDKAVDLHLIKQALEAKHFQNWKFLFEEFQKGYVSNNKEQAKEVLEQLKKVESRGRYKH